MNMSTNMNNSQGIDYTQPAKDQPRTRSGPNRTDERGFECRYDDQVQWHTFSGWADVTGIKVGTIKGRFYHNRSANQCLEIDPIMNTKKTPAPRRKFTERDRRNAVSAFIYRARGEIC